MFVDLTWASITGFFTPTLLFLLLNLMIAIIALITKLNTQNQHQNKPNQPTIATSPSPHRTAIPDSETTIPNLNTQSRDFFQQVSERFEAPQSQAAYLFDESSERTGTLFFSEPKESSSDDSRNDQQSMDEIYSKLTTRSHFIRPSDSSGDMPAKFPARMGKSGSLKSALGHFEEEEIVEARRPATVREAKVTEGDAEVDAKADDFINRFREQLKLQRVESVIKYKNIMMSGEVNVI